MKNLIFTALLFLGITTQAQTCLDYTIRFDEKVRKDTLTKVCVDSNNQTISFNNEVYQITDSDSNNEYYFYKTENKGIINYIIILKENHIISIKNEHTNKLTAYAL